MFTAFLEKFNEISSVLYRQDSSLTCPFTWVTIPSSFHHFSYMNQPGLDSSHLLLTTFILVQNRSVRTKINWLSCSFPKEISVNKWSHVVRKTHSTLQSGFQIVLKIQKPYGLEQNDLLCGYHAPSRLGTTSSWHCLKKLVLNTTWIEPKVFMPQWEAQIIERKMWKAVFPRMCNFSVLSPTQRNALKVNKS